MQILGVSTERNLLHKDRTFKTVPAGLRYMVRAVHNGWIGRKLEIINYTAPIVYIELLNAGVDEGVPTFILYGGAVDGWEVGDTKTLDEAIALTKSYHRE